MNVIRTYKRINIASIALFLFAFGFASYTEGAPAWRILIIMAFFQALFFLVTLPLLKKRLAEAEKQQQERGEE